MSDDPFFIVKREVEQSLSLINTLFQQRQANSQQDTRKIDTDIQDRILNIGADLEELDDTVKIVEGNPTRFKINLREIEDRKLFIATTRKYVIDMRSKLKGGSDLKKPAAERQERTQRNLEAEQQQQQIFIDNQDRKMDEVAITVRNIREIGHIMGEELDDQSRLLNEVDQHVDETSGRMQDGLKRMKDFIKANSSIKQQLTIIGLIVLLIVLMIVVISF